MTFNNSSISNRGVLLRWQRNAPARENLGEAVKSRPFKVHALLSHGLVDSIFQFGATTGLRLILVGCLFIVAYCLEPDDITKFDLFIISSTFFMLAQTIGMDSGLAVSSLTKDESERGRFLVGAIVVVFILAVISFVPGYLISKRFMESELYPFKVFLYSFAYATCNSVLTLVFSYLRWIGKSRRASVALVGCNATGALMGVALFAMQRSVQSFMLGMTTGCAIGALYCLFQIKESAQRISSVTEVLDPIKKLVLVSWPYCLASFSLLGRRSVDRLIILVLLGDPSLLASYIVLSRIAETFGFVLGVPSMGLNPLILNHFDEGRTRKFAVRMLVSFDAMALLLTVVCGCVMSLGGDRLLPANATEIAPVVTVLVAANLILTSLQYGGFGYIISGKTYHYALLSFGFVAAYGIGAYLLFLSGLEIASVVLPFLIAATVFSLTFMFSSERLHCFGYPKVLLTGLRFSTATIALLFYLGNSVFK